MAGKRFKCPGCGKVRPKSWLGTVRLYHQMTGESQDLVWCRKCRQRLAAHPAIIEVNRIAD